MGSHLGGSEELSRSEMTIVWRDGRLVESAEATIPLMSAAVHRGTSVFDVLPVVEIDGGRWAVGAPFHFERLVASAAQMGLPFDLTPDGWTEAVAAVVGRLPRGFDTAVVRTVVADAASPRGGVAPIVTVAIEAEPASFESRPLRVATAVAKIDPRVLPAEVKVAAIYAGGLRAERLAKADGYDAVINVDRDGKLLEGVSAAVGVIANDRLLLPPVGSVLDSVTRRLVIDVAADNGLITEVRPVDIAEVIAAASVFFASSTRPVVPVESVDRTTLDPSEPHLDRLRAGVAQVLSGNHDLSRRWLDGLSR